MKSALKWPGGKRKLLEAYAPYFPPPGAAHDLIEPMCGAAALALAWRLRWEGRTYISDWQGDLMAFYGELRRSPRVVRHVRQLIEHYNGFPPEEQKDLYYSWRHLLNARSLPADMLAAIFWVVNRTCFNGLPRYNSKGNMNTPWGQHRKVSPKLVARLVDLMEILQRDEVFSLGKRRFQDALKLVSAEGTIAFFDPPYWGAWVDYTKEGFGWDEQVLLAAEAKTFLEEGGLPYVCNADCAEIRELYEGVLVPIEMSAPRSINSDGAGRGSVSELLFVPPQMADLG